MGYTYNPKSNYLVISGIPTSPITATTTNQDLVLPTIPALTGLKGTIFFATAELNLTGLHDTSGAENYIDTLYLEVADTTPTYQACLVLPVCQYVGANEYHIGNQSFYANTDISSYLDLSSVTTFRIHNLTAHGNNLIIYGAQIKLILFLEP